jgi:hypothetical protein
VRERRLRGPRRDQRDRSVPLGKYWRSRPLVFSFVGRCQGECGSAKNTFVPVSSVNCRVGGQSPCLGPRSASCAAARAGRHHRGRGRRSSRSRRSRPARPVLDRRFPCAGSLPARGASGPACVAAGALHDGADRGAASADDQVTLPMPGMARSSASAGRSLTRRPRSRAPWACAATVPVEPARPGRCAGTRPARASARHGPR